MYWRLRPSAVALARGFVRLRRPGDEGAGASVRLPVGETPPLLFASPAKAPPAIDPAEGGFEPAAALDRLAAAARRCFTSLGQSILRFDAFEAFPEGTRDETRRYRKQLAFARRAGLALDGRFVRERPELFEGFAPLARPAAVDAPRLAVVVHLHYFELWPEIENLIAGWPIRPRLFVSLTREAPELSARIEARFPGARIRAMENRGRDVRPFLVWLEAGALDGFDLVCKIHGKRSLGGGRHAAFGDLMRRAIFLDLIAGADTVERILARFAAAPRLGLLGPRRYRSASVDAASVDVLGPNRATAEALARRLGAPIVGPRFDFFEGTMFWARPPALAPLAALALARDGFAPESGGLEGQLEHALERLFNHAVRAAGYEVAAVAVDDPA